MKYFWTISGTLILIITTYWSFSIGDYAKDSQFLFFITLISCILAQMAIYFSALASTQEEKKNETK